MKGVALGEDYNNEIMTIKKRRSEGGFLGLDTS